MSIHVVGEYLRSAGPSEWSRFGIVLDVNDTTEAERLAYEVFYASPLEVRPWRRMTINGKRVRGTIGDE